MGPASFVRPARDRRRPRGRQRSQKVLRSQTTAADGAVASTKTRVTLGQGDHFYKKKQKKKRDK